MTEQMTNARRAALDILKPSKRDLDYGLSLHAESIVCDTYGFSPTGPVDADALNAAAEAGASPNELQDLREEMMMTRHVHDPAELEEYRVAWETSAVTCVFQNAGQEGQSVKRLLKRLARFTYVTDALPDLLVRAVRPDQIREAAARGRHCLYFTANGVPLAEEWESVEGELAYIRVLFQLGVRMMHLTYNRQNMIGGGCGERADSGLSDFGRAVVAAMNRTGVIVDVAHSGPRTSLEAARLSAAPMVASHSAACGVNEHIRGKSDAVIRAIADSGGYIGICCIPAFLGGTGGIDALLDHVDYVARTVGVEHVAIGTDHGTASSRAAAALRKVRGMPKRRRPWEMLWPPGALDAPGVSEKAKLSLAWTNWPLFTVGLVQRGYGDADIRRIIGGNMLRVAEAVLAHSVVASRPEREVKACEQAAGHS